MKKLYNILTMMALMATVTLGFTSCDDAEIARTLEGTWRGNMYISSSYGGRNYDATYTEITFLKDPGAYSSGNGYWVDYYDTGRYRDLSRNYVANHIEWTVDYGTIRIYFVEEGTSFDIYDYHLDDDRFYGKINDNGQRVDFELVHTSSPNWSNYRYWGYDDWYDDWYYDYYARTRSENAGSTVGDKPHRYIRSEE